MSYISKFILFFILRWKIIGDFPKEIKQYVLIAVPHTSWMDVPLGLLIRSITKTNIHFVGKKSLFKKPYGFFFRSLGGFPIDRTASNNTVDLLIEKFKENENFILAISPEGTRQKVESWKTGFYYIAKGANIPIVKVAFDYQNKKITIDHPFYPTDDVNKDITSLYDYFKGIKGKHAHLS
jgi:1-acyl-sn-glycerol-3-phosphate acyltransferase